MEIKSINYNWFITTENEEQFTNRTVGFAGVVRIEEHRAAGEGDKWYYDIFYSDGSKERIFNPNQVYYTS